MGSWTWRLWIDEQPRPGWSNMAVDMALLDRAEHQDECWLRLYRWDPYCLSFGRHEPASLRYDTERIRDLGLDTVRRPTGGRAVWHGAELTYAVASPIVTFGSIPAAYHEIHQVLGRALGDLGLETALAPRTRLAGLDAGGCFTQPVGGEVLVSGRKVVGSAQLRRGSALLQHGSILLHDQQSFVSSLLRNSWPHETRCSITHTAFHLVDGGGRPVPAATMAGAVARAAALHWTGAWEQITDPRSVLSAARAHASHFQSSSWTWAR